MIEVELEAAKVRVEPDGDDVRIFIELTIDQLSVLRDTVMQTWREHDYEHG